MGGNNYKLANSIAVLTPKAVWDAIFTEKPYPIKAMLLHGTNPVITRANSNEVYRALSQLDFLAVTDFFLTPTAELADIVLPAATWLEFDDIGDYLFRHGYVFARKQVVQIGECWSDHKILITFWNHRDLPGSSLKKWVISRERWSTGNMKRKVSPLPRKRSSFTPLSLRSGGMTLYPNTGRYRRAR